MKNSTFSFIKIITSTALIFMLNIAHASPVVAKAQCYVDCNIKNTADLRKARELCNQSKNHHASSTCRINASDDSQANLERCKKRC